MRAVVHRFHSPDALDLDSYVPDDPADDAILLQVMVGSEGADGEDSFDVLVCTLRRLERLVESEGRIIGRHYLIVKPWTTPQLSSISSKSLSENLRTTGRI